MLNMSVLQRYLGKDGEYISFHASVLFFVCHVCLLLKGGEADSNMKTKSTGKLMKIVAADSKGRH